MEAATIRVCAHRFVHLAYRAALQACSRGYLARRAGHRTMRAVLLLQRMLRGHLGRTRRDRVRIEREQERKTRAKVRDVVRDCVSRFVGLGRG